MPRQPSAASRRRQQQREDPSSSSSPPPLHPSQQINHPPNEVFYYDHRHRVIICLWCKCAILDAPFKDHLGTRSHKTYRHLNRYDEFRAYLESFPQRVKKTEEIVITPEPIPVVRGLSDPLYPSYQCTFDRCGYVGMGIPQIKEHCTTRHGWTNPQRRGRPSKKRKLEEEAEDAAAAAERKRKLEQDLPWVTVASQQFFPRGRGSQRFRVFTPAEAAAAGYSPSAACATPADGSGNGSVNVNVNLNGSGGDNAINGPQLNRANPTAATTNPTTNSASTGANIHTTHHSNGYTYPQPELSNLEEYSSQGMPQRPPQPQPQQQQHQPGNMQHAHPQHHQQHHQQPPQPSQQQQQQQQQGQQVDSLAGVDEETARRLLANA